MKRSDLLKIMADGRICRVSFIKRSTGERRDMVARLGVTSHLKGGEKSFKDEDKDLITVFDMQKRAYRSIPCENILEVRHHGSN